MVSIRKIKRNYFIFLAFLVLGGLDFVNALAAEHSKEMIAFGDSITQGYPEVGDPPYGLRVGGYEPDLELLTDARNDHYNVYNYGIGGETTMEGIQRFNIVMAQHPNASYVLLLEGTNDIWSAIPREDTVWMLSAMVDKARNFGIEPILGTLTPDPRSGAGDFKNVPLYNTMIRSMAEDKDVVLAELYDEMVTDWVTVYTDDDLLHPNRAGYAKMAEVWFKTVFPCSSESLGQCATESDCLGASGYWYANACNVFAPPLNGTFLLLLGTP